MKPELGRCCWQIEYGTVNVSVLCNKPTTSKYAPFCREHTRDFREMFPGQPMPKHEALTEESRSTKGRGFGLYVKGQRVLNVNELKVGALLLEHSPQFNADNTVIVTREFDSRVWVRFVNPMDWRESMGNEFCIWDFYVEMGHVELWRAVPTQLTVPEPEEVTL